MGSLPWAGRPSSHLLPDAGSYTEGFHPRNVHARAGPQRKAIWYCSLSPPRFCVPSGGSECPVCCREQSQFQGQAEGPEDPRPRPPALFPLRKRAPTLAPTPHPPIPQAPFSDLATHPGLTLSCKAGAQHVHGMHREGGHTGGQAAAQEVHGEVAGIAHAGPVHQLGQHFK